MSIWDIFGKIGKAVISPFTGGGDRAAQQRMMNEQIKAYQEQTAITRAETSRLKDEQVAEKRRIQEKQIRSLRRAGSSRGFLGSSNEAGLSSKLGG